MRIHIRDLEREIAKAQRERETLIGKRNEAENALGRPGLDRWLVAARIEDIRADIDEIDQYLEIIEDPDILEPCTSVARAAGCTCAMTPWHGPPEAIRSRDCPLHGSEPDEDDRP